MASPYLADALRSLSAQPAAPQGPDIAAMARTAQGVKDWKAANPGKSYLANAMRRAGANIAGAPGRVSNLLAGSIQSQPGAGVAKAAAGQPPDPQQAAGLPLDRVSLQPGLMQNGNAAPQFTLPTWASDGSGNDAEGLASRKTFFNVPEQMSPFLQPNQWGVLPGTNLSAQDYADVAAGKTIPAQIETQRQIARMMAGGPIAGTQPLDPQPQGITPMSQGAAAPVQLPQMNMASQFQPQQGGLPQYSPPGLDPRMGWMGPDPQQFDNPQLQGPSPYAVSQFFHGFGYGA